MVQDTAGVQPGPDTGSSDVSWSDSGSRPQFQRAELKQNKAGVFPVVVETDIDMIENDLLGSRGHSQAVADETKHCEREQSGRCRHIMETDIDEVYESLAGETKHSQTSPCRRFNRILETDLDEIKSTFQGTSFGSHCEVVTDETKPQGRLPGIMETDIDAFESGVPLSEELAGETKQHGESEQSIGLYGSLETHLDKPDPTLYESNLGISQDNDEVRRGGVMLTRRPTGPIAIESLGEVFETSLDGSQCDSDYGDVDAICLELDSDGFVYWAEPIRVSSTSPALSQSDCHQGCTRPPSAGGPIGLDSSSSSPDRAIHSLSSRVPETSSSETLPCMAEDMDTDSPPASPPLPARHQLNQQNFKKCRSVSVQMPSYPLTRSVSHIVKRKDVIPYSAGNTKPNPMSTSLPCLDMSTPLRAVQSWTDLQMQRKGLSATSWGCLQTSLRPGSLRAVNTEKPLSPDTVFSSDPTFVTASNSRWSTDSLPESAASFQSNSVSLDTGLWPEEEDEDIDMKVGRVKERLEEKLLWEGNHKVCCCSCDRRHTCARTRLSRQPSEQDLPYSLDELEGMISCLQKFRVVLANIEEQVSDEQAAVLNVLSETDREVVCDITELRKAVKQEASKLELQLNELAHHYDDNIKMKMHRLLNEQSLLCSQLRLLPPPVMATPVLEIAPPTRSISTQCRLRPFPMAQLHSDLHASTEALEPELPPSPECLATDSPTLGCSATKPDKMDFVGFLQRLKESLRPSLNSESLE